MSYFLQNLITALNHGSQYALIALGYTMVYGVLRLINFAHGDVFMLGAFIGAFIAEQLTGGAAETQTYAQAFAGIYCAVCFCGCVGYLIERFAYRPLRRSSKLSSLITAIGVSLLIEYLAQMSWSSRLIDILITAAVAFWTIYFPYALAMLAARRFGRPRWLAPMRMVALIVPAVIVIPLCILHLVHALPQDIAAFFGPTPQQFLRIQNSEKPWNPLGIPIGDYLNDHYHVVLITKDVIVITTTLIVLAILRFLVRHTRTGKAMRAVSQNYDAARLMGIDLNRIISFTFILGSMLAAVGGCLTGLSENQCTPLMGLTLGLKAFIAAVIGGIGNIPGAALGGLILGLIETYVSSVQYHNAAILSPYKDAIAFFILILVLLVKPEGLFGKAVPEKV